MTLAPVSAGFCGRPGLRCANDGELALGTGAEGLARGTGGGHVWLHGADARVHDFHAGVAGDFAAACDRLRGGARAVSTVLTRSNVRGLAGLAGWLGERGVTAWRVVVARGPVIDGVTPRLAVALPYALQALALAGRSGVAGWIDGAPHCLLGPFRGSTLSSRARAYAAGCVGCPARASCPGVDAGYLERFGEAELSARALREAGASPRIGGDLFDA